jgi:hypothetical protein
VRRIVRARINKDPSRSSRSSWRLSIARSMKAGSCRGLRPSGTWKKVAVIGSGRRPGRRRSTESRRPQRDRVREVRSHRRACCVTASRNSSSRSVSSIAARSAVGRRRGVSHARRTSARLRWPPICAASSTRSCSPAAPASLAI